MHQRNPGKSLRLPEGWAALLRAAWILTVSQSDWPESRMYLIPDVADSSAVDSIKSVSCFLTRTRLCNTRAWNPTLALHLYCKWNYLFKNHSAGVLIFAGFLLSEGKWSCIQPPALSNLRWEQFRVGLWAFWVVSHCLCDFLWLLSLWRKEEKMFIDLGRWSAWF